ncbi:MAG: acyltransferase [Alphaproteobacteria bacterium]|nr:acyltransferase [Alphaproteobacteria bacterium]
MLFHFGATTHFHDWRLVRNAWAAVDFFFTLSGFVIASAYYEKLRHASEFVQYAIRRVGRLYPLHLCVLAVYVGIELVHLLYWHAPDAFTGNRSVEGLVQSLFLVQGFTANHECWNYPAWSISVELWVNLSFGAVVLAAGRRFPLAALVIAVAFVAAIWWEDLWLDMLTPELAGALNDVASSVLEFTLGVLAYQLYAAFRARGLKPWAVLEPLAAAIGAYIVLHADTLPDLTLPAFCCGLIFLFAFEGGPLSSVLKTPRLVQLGTYSYSIYLTHSLYLYAFGLAVLAAAHALGIPGYGHAHPDLLAAGGPWAMDAAAALCVACTIGGSALTYRYIEEPGRRGFNRVAVAAGAVAGGRSYGRVQPAFPR